MSESLEIQCDDLIKKKIFDVVLEFEKTWRRHPSHIILSPVAYLQLKAWCEYLQLEAWCETGRRLGALEKFFGLPIVCADTASFITCGIPDELVASYEWRRTREVREV